MEPSYLMVTWSDFARNQKHYYDLIQDGSYIAVTKSSHIVATLHPYKGEDISVHQPVPANDVE